MIVSNKKYACETCIKGHRSSACKHTARPLFEIKKKGRPVTQCEHCRELRKTKQVHVKCICESKVDYSASQQGPIPGFESAAFPNGLPEALEATVAFQNPVEGTSSDSDPGGVMNGHHCKSGDPCKCVLPRARTKLRGPSQAQLNPALPSGSSPSSSRDFLGHPSQSSPSQSSSQILARIAVLRPVLPRPPQQDMGFPLPGPVHNPSTGIPHGHASNRHHDNYAPYTRHGMAPQNIAHPQSYVASLASSNSTFPFTEQLYHHDAMQMMGSPPHPTWPSQMSQRHQGNLAVDNVPSMCNCGDDCACPGCVHHSRSTLPSPSAYASCRNPDRCGTCLDCTIMSLPASAILPPDTALSIYGDPSQNDAIDDWLRQTSASDLNSSDFQQGFPVHGAGGGVSLEGWNSNPSPNRAFSENNSIPRDPRGMPNYNFPSNGMVQPHHRSSMSSNRSQQSVYDPRLLSPNPTMMRGGGDSGNPPFFNVQRDRSPSTSSQSSHHGSDIHSNSVGGRPNGRMQGMFTDARGARSPPQLNTRQNMARGPSSSASISPSPSSGSSGPRSVRYGSCIPEMASDYDPSLNGLQIY